MITIDVKQDEQKQIIGYSVQGHAGYAQAGQDIVCAAVSALAMASLNGLEEHLHHEVQYSIADGHIDCALLQAPDSLTQAILVTMVMGMENIAQQYPKRVRVKGYRR